ncbi:hypothetical protein ABEF95_006446 [Exophiala dermatitidis]
MADALCGPANPLQNLQKHSQVDRTLQQDRLVGHRQSPSQVTCSPSKIFDYYHAPTDRIQLQGFRTSDPRAGAIVDADFHAFENAAPGPFQFQQQPAAFHAQAAAGPGPVAGWAADFKRLSLTEQQSQQSHQSQSPIPVPAGQFRAEAPLVRSTTLGGWQNEFVRQRSSPVAQGKQAVRDPGPMVDSFSSSSMMMGNNYSYDYSQQQQQSMYQHSHMAGVGVYGGGSVMGGGLDQQQQQQQHAQMSDVDYEAAFAEVIAHAQEMDQQQQFEDTQTQQPASVDQLGESLQQAESDQTIKIGSDAIQYRDQKADSQKNPEQDRRDADELARTAGLLLNSVQHDTSSKFQNSQFLDLMRRIRDREVEVQNNDLQTVGSNSQSHSQTLHNRQPQQNQTSTAQEDMPSHFQFPDMDAVYAPDVAAHDTDTEQQQHPLHRSPFTTYGFDDDSNAPAMQPQQNQTGDALHPGGKWYPDQQSPRPGAARVEELSMSGAIPSGGDGIIDDGAGLERMVSASEFGHVDGTAGLARRFVPGDAWAGPAAGDAEMGA